MTEPAFVHLRVRSCFSLLESTVRVPKLLDRCVADGMPAIGVVDKANLFNALAFSQAATGKGVQPIVGCLLPIRDESERRGNGKPVLDRLALLGVQGAEKLHAYSTVTLLARLRGWSTSQPRSTAMWYASSCSGIAATIG